MSEETTVVKIHEVDLQNVLAFKSKTLRLGKKATIISSKNHTFKSCLLEAIKAGTSGGTKNDMDLVHGIEENGRIVEREKQGKIRIVLDDEDGDVLTKTIYADKASKLDITGTTRPGAYLTELFGAGYINPVEFYNATPEKQVEMALRVLPLKFDRNMFAGIIGHPVKPDAKPLETVDYWYQGYYKERTEAGGALKKAKIRTEDQRRVVPLEDPVVPTERITELEGLRKQAESVLAESRAKLEAKVSARKSELQALRDEAIKKANDEYALGLESLSEKTRGYQEQFQNTFNDAVALIDPELGSLREKAKNYEMVVKQHELLHKLELEEQLCQEDWELNDRIVKQIEAARETLLASSGIEGVDIKPDGIWINGAPWKHVNRARRMMFANEMAERSCGKMKLIIVDDMESLDKENYQWQLEHMANSGFQYVAAKVGKSDTLSIRIIDTEDDLPRVLEEMRKADEI